MKDVVVKIDVDDVVLELVSTWLKLYGMMTGENVEPGQIKTWNISSYTSQPGLFRSILSWPHLYQLCQLSPGALPAITTLREFATIIYVTAQDNPSKSARLRELDVLTSEDYYVVSSDKTLVTGQWLVDDNYSNVLSHPDKQKSLLYSRPWNEGSRWKNRIVSLPDAVDFIARSTEHA